MKGYGTCIVVIGGEGILNTQGVIFLLFLWRNLECCNNNRPYMDVIDCRLVKELD